MALTPGNDLCNRNPNPAYPNSAPQYPLDNTDGGDDYSAFVAAHRPAGLTAYRFGNAWMTDSPNSCRESGTAKSANHT